MTSPASNETRFLHAIDLGLGSQQWGDRMLWNYGLSHSDDDIRSLFKAVLEQGICFVDTAETYGMGRSERMLGRLLKENQAPVLVATKFMPFPWRLTRNTLYKALAHSLERLQLESVDLYQMHWPVPTVPIELWMDAMVEVVQRGQVRTVGVSNYNQSQMMRAYSALARKQVPLAANQVEYSLLDRQVEKNGLLARCQELGVRLIAYSPLAKGMLTGKYSTQNPPPGMRGRKYGGMLSRIEPLVKTMTQIGQDHGGKSMGQVALNWLICKGALPIPGAKNPTQALANAGALGWRLTPDQVHILDEASDRITAR